MSPDSGNAGAAEPLYPFLCAETTGLLAVLAEARASTAAKTGEITGLRQEVAHVPRDTG